MRRSKTDKIIGGVCGGIGKYFDINPWAPRLVFLLSGGFWIYVILWIALKEDSLSESFFVRFNFIQPQVDLLQHRLKRILYYH